MTERRDIFGRAAPARTIINLCLLQIFDCFKQDATGRTGDLTLVEKGTIHTKRHSGEDPAKARYVVKFN